MRSLNRPAQREQDGEDETKQRISEIGGKREQVVIKARKRDFQGKDWWISLNAAERPNKTK